MRFSQKSGQFNEENSKSLNKMKAKKDKVAENTAENNKKRKTKRLDELVQLQKEKNRMKESMASILKRNDIESGRRTRSFVGFSNRDISPG